MSNRNKRGKNNVTYLHKNKSKNTKVAKKRNVVKKKQINKKKLGLLIIGVIILSFGAIKSTKGIGTFVKNISNNAIKPSDAQIVDSQKQYDLNEEKKLDTKKYTIFIDPGHGGDDKGFQSKETGKYEKDITLEIGKKLASKLSTHNDINVIITRSDDADISISDRLQQAKSQRADILVSLHLNTEGTKGNTANGIETYYKNDELNNSDELARYIHDSILSYVKLKDRGIGVSDSEILKDATMASVMLKCGFISNPEEEKKLTEEKFLDEYTDGIAQGILSYIDVNK